jgi:hypothetical protein
MRVRGCDCDEDDWEEDDLEFEPGWLITTEKYDGPLLDSRGDPFEKPFTIGFHSSKG